LPTTNILRCGLWVKLHTYIGCTAKLFPFSHFHFHFHSRQRHAHSRGPTNCGPMLNNDARQIFRRMQQSRGCGCHLHAIGIAIANPSRSSQPTDADADAICPSLLRFIRLLLQIYELCLAQFLYKRSWALACTHRNPT